jgi:NADH-quinone oxidoreductase subunit C
MTNETIQQQLIAKFGEKIANFSMAKDILTFEIDPTANLEVIGFLKNELAFNFLTDLCAIHYPNKTGKEVGVIYNMHNMMANVRVIFKAFMPESKTEIQSATPLFAAANWMERETFDFFGVKFLNHPNLKRILNVDDMDYFPLLKQYELEDATRTDKDDRYFGREGHEGRVFDERRFGNSPILPSK